MSMGELPVDILDHLEKHSLRLSPVELVSRAGNVWMGPSHVAIGCRAERYHENVLVPNGDVYGCCMDYGLTVPLGNLLAQPYSEIYAEAERWKTSVHTNDICSRCEWATTGPQRSLDSVEAIRTSCTA